MATARVRKAARVRPIPAWNRPIDELRAEAEAADDAAASFPKALKLRGLPKIPRAQLLTVPETFPASFYENQPSFLSRLFCRPRLRVRKNQRNLTTDEWTRFLDAFTALTDPGLPLAPPAPEGPRLEDFVDLHADAVLTPAGRAWGAHSFAGDGRNFLAWHREYLAKFEAALMTVNPYVTIPYWNWVNDRAIPERLNSDWRLSLVWRVSRGSGFDASALPLAREVNFALSVPNFSAFSDGIEGPHDRVHNAFLGNATMRSPEAPKDPLFWLHHAFVDKLWTEWQTRHPGQANNPQNVSEVLQPPPIMTRAVANVVSTRSLGYVYA